jgi:transcriptional regulator with XRE-family HTH domain
MTGQELRAAREQLGMTQAALAATLGVSLSHLGNYERGVRRQTGQPCPIPRTVEFAVRWLLCQANREIVDERER